MNREEMAKVMEEIFQQMQFLRDAGQADYAHKDSNAFANFERVGERLNIPREKVALVYLEKHVDAIHAYANGHRSTREDVRGRILDIMVYLCLIYGMVEENEGKLEIIKEPIR